jgi:hypothetical protein
MSARLDQIKILYRDVNMRLWGIPYEMRPGQQPWDLYSANRDHDNLVNGTGPDLSDWIYIEEIKVFLGTLPDGALPVYPDEWSLLEDFRQNCTSEV